MFGAVDKLFWDAWPVFSPGKEVGNLNLTDLLGNVATWEECSRMGGGIQMIKERWLRWDTVRKMHIDQWGRFNLSVTVSGWSPGVFTKHRRKDFPA